MANTPQTIMKNIVAIFLSLSIIAIFFNQAIGQNTVKINWTGETTIQTPNSQALKRPSFEQAFHEIQFDYLPSYRLSLPFNVANFTLSNETYTALEEGYATANLSNTPIEIIKSSLKRKTVSDINILTIRKNPNTGVIEKLVSFEYTYTIDQTNIATPKRTKNTNASSSVLASGDWYKLGFTNTGLYKIDYNYLVAMGINPGTINPQNIKIYGNGGGMLPQPNSSPRPTDLMENAIFVQGENDQIFNAEDYILFYVQGPNTWRFDSSNDIFAHTKNLYSDSSFYFLTISNQAGARIQTTNEASGASQTYNYFNEMTFHENDAVNLLKSGREWYGEKFSQSGYDQTISFNIPDLRKDSTIKILSNVMANSKAVTSSTLGFDIDLNNVSIGTHTIKASGSVAYTTIGINSPILFKINNSNFNYSADLNLHYKFNRGIEPTATGYLNYITINALRELRVNNNYLAFRNLKSKQNTVSKFVISNPGSGLMVWDVSTPSNVNNQNYTNEGDGTVSFQFNSTILREFIAFNGNAFPTPVFYKKISNQNIRQNNSTNLMIVTIPAFIAEANKIAALRQQHDNLSVSVVVVNEIYNEFSSGAQDITAIRDYVKHIYEKGIGSKDSLQYLLLFGACSYDYKNRVNKNTNYVPVYESYNSLHPVQSQSSDDYYGFLDDNEGRWSESPADLHKLDIGIGRIPVRTTTEAAYVTNKLITYADQTKSSGKWRNKISFLADAGDANLHVSQANKLAASIESKYKQMNVDRIFLDAYPFVTFPDGVKAPEAIKAIDNTVNTGALIVNYTGHGGETQLSTKKIITIPQIQSWKNINNLPFFVTATCEVSRYDDPEIFSAGEIVLISPNGGGIGLLSSSRPVYSSSNATLNTALYSILFNKDLNNNHYRLGDIMMYTKNNSLIGIDNRNYAILGDPSMTLNYAEKRITLDSILSYGVTKAITKGIDTVKALAKITIKGAVRELGNTIITDYNGTIYISYFDKPLQLSTLGQESGTGKFNYSNFQNLIYDGLATVNNGIFEFTFVVPKDISYQFDFGKISTYAIDNNFKTDATGYNFDLYVGGTNNNAPTDITPPKVSIFLNDESFVQGGTSNASPLLITKLFDEGGINITGAGVGHELTAMLDNNSANILVLNKYYTSTKDNYKEGKAAYRLSNLSPGLHSIKVKAWDSYNNSGENTLEFIVANSDKIALNHVLNYPNPFNNHTTFHFDHNRAGDNLSVQIQVFTASGKLLKTLETEIVSSNSHFSDLSWDGKDDFGDNIGKGVYVYKVKVGSKIDGAVVHRYEKLVILN